MVMKHPIPITIMGAMSDKISAKIFVAEVVNQFIKSDKIETKTHLNKLVNMRYNRKKKSTL